MVLVSNEQPLYPYIHTKNYVIYSNFYEMIFWLFSVLVGIENSSTK